MTKLCFFFLIFTSIALFSSEKTPNYQTIKPVADGAIAAIEAKDADKLFDNYVSPKDIKEVLKKENIDGIKKEFMNSEKAAALLFVLKSLEKMDCTYDAKEDCLTFKGKDLADLKFSREAGKWYIKN